MCVCGVVWVAFRSWLHVASGLLKSNYSHCQGKNRDAIPQQPHTPELVFSYTALLYHFLFPLKLRERGLAVFMPLFAASKNVCYAYQLVDFGLG